MREDNLLAVRYRKFVTTTESEHGHRVYLNLAGRMEVTGINQLWVADITYIRLREEFVYLAVILDAYSRRVIGWALERSIQARLTVTALLQAIQERKPPPGLVHHSDRGAQYACAEYVAELSRHQILPSMSRPGCPYDNAACESFIKTLKQEEIYANQYRDLEHLRENLQDFLDHYYNRVRLHSALNYQSPALFEAALPAPPMQSRAAAFEFSKA
jgi:transposase InsO family protein